MPDFDSLHQDVPPWGIERLASGLALGRDQVEPFGWYKGKFALGLHERLATLPSGKYVNVTAISPTPLGEGKTVTAIGLAMALQRIGKRSIVTLRQPSLGPLFGIKGGGAGGGKARLFPFDDVNLHLTGDIHAVAAATNLLAAVIDNHVGRRLSPALDPATINWRRCVDICDRSLRTIETGISDEPHGVRRRTSFDLAPASEMMAILALATSLEDLRVRLGRIVIGQSPDGPFVTADDLKVAGALTALLRDALRPNLVQTCEGTPALVHTGPFANIAHGNSSVIADLAAIRLADFVVTESGFGADCGAEKFFNIKCRVSGLRPDVEVLVCTTRALKLHSGQFSVHAGRPLPRELTAENLPAIHAGAANLQAHLEILRLFGVPVVVAINHFPDDHDREVAAIERIAHETGATAVAVTTAFQDGGAGAVSLAEAVSNASTLVPQFRFLYPDDLPVADKIATIATKVYGADGVDFAPDAARQLKSLHLHGFDQLPVCIAKTQYSLSHDPALRGRPLGFRFPIRSVRLAAGAGYIYALSGDIQTMPALPAEPAATRIDIDAAGNVIGLT